MSLNIDNQVIYTHEGGVLTKGYVPGKGTGVGAGSGVTIGAGVDLAFHFLTELSAWGMSQEHLTAVAPYVAYRDAHSVHLGPRGVAAEDLLVQNGGLELPLAEITTLSNNCIASYADHTAAQWNQLTRNSRRQGTSFEDLPGTVQTALVDLSYLTGSLTANALPEGLPAAIEACSWRTVAQLLQTSPTARFRDDGHLIQRAIDGNELPDLS